MTKHFDNRPFLTLHFTAISQKKNARTILGGIYIVKLKLMRVFRYGLRWIPHCTTPWMSETGSMLYCCGLQLAIEIAVHITTLARQCFVTSKKNRNGLKSRSWSWTPNSQRIFEYGEYFRRTNVTFFIWMYLLLPLHPYNWTLTQYRSGFEPVIWRSFGTTLKKNCLPQNASVWAKLVFIDVNSPRVSHLMRMYVDIDGKNIC